MPVNSFDIIIKDLQANKDVTSRLKKVFALSAKDLPRAKRLEFTQSVLKEVTFRNSEEAHEAFQLAITSLRKLVPFLKTKGQSLQSVQSAVERRSVNHAFGIFFSSKPVGAKLQSSAALLMEESLKTILGSRASPAKKIDKCSSRQRKPTKHANKENSDPQHLSDTTCDLRDSILDRCLFEGASALGMKACLPNSDATGIAPVVSGALMVKLTALSPVLQSSELLAFAKQVVVPWVRYCRSDTKDSKQQNQKNLKSVQMTLFSAAQIHQTDPYTTLKLRAYALTLVEVSLKRYARDLLRTVHCLTRANVEHRCNVYDVVGSVYDEALQFVDSFDFDNPDWFSEDVSSWMDHVAVIWSRRSRSQPTPTIFEKRISALQKTKDESDILSCCELQLRLIRADMYRENIVVSDGDGDICFNEDVFEELEGQLAKLSFPSLSALAVSGKKTKSGRRSPRSMQRLGLRRLRLVRILEPLRRCILASAAKVFTLPRGALFTLESYVSAVFSGLVETRTVGLKLSSSDADSIAEIQTRIDKMSGAAFEASAELARAYFEGGEENDLIILIRSLRILCELHEEHSRQSARKWRKWIAGVFVSELRNSLQHAPKLSHTDRTDVFTRTASVGDECEKYLFAGRFDDGTFESIRMELLAIVRACHVFLKDWPSAAEISLKRIDALMKSPSYSDAEQTNGRSLREACSDFAKDMAHTFGEDIDPVVFLDSDCPLEFLLAVVMDYCACLTRSNPPSPTTSKNQEALRNLLKVRAFLLQKLGEKSPEGLCAQRQLHIAWILMSSQGDNQEQEVDREELFYRLSNCAQISCRHSPPDILLFAGDSMQCSRDHRIYIEAILKCMLATADGEFNVINDGLGEARAILSSSESLSQDLELMFLSSEILQWVEYVTALHDFSELSTMAHELWQLCSSDFSISSSSNIVANYCIYLSQLVSYRDIWSIPEFVHRVGAGVNESDLVRETNSQEVLSTTHDPDEMSYSFKQLEAAHRDLKTSLIPFLRASSRESIVCPKPCHIAGVNIDLNYEVKLHTGRESLHGLLFLIESLYRLARLLLLVENLADGRYYLERCQYVALQSLPSENLFCQSLTAVETLATPTNFEEEDPLQLLECGLSSGANSEGKSRRSTFVMRLTIANALLEKASKRFTSPIDSEVGAEMLLFFDDCEGLLQGMTDEEAQLSDAELSLGRGLTHAFTNSHSSALKFITGISTDVVQLPKHFKALCSYFVARTLVAKEGGLHIALEGSSSTNVGNAKPVRRVTRSQGKKGGPKKQGSVKNTIITEVQNLLSRSLEEISQPFLSPRLERRVWNLRSVTASAENDTLLSVQKVIGCSFNIRWGASIRSKATRSQRSGSGERPAGIDELGDAFESMNISVGKNEGDGFLRLLQERLCVVIGLGVDETREGLLLRRLSANGVISKRLRLPDTGDQSFSGVLVRISNVISAMKEWSVKVGYSFTSEEKQAWWDHRFSLDSEVKKIVTDIESDWFGEFKDLLLPWIFSAEFLKSRKVREGDVKAFVDMCTSAAEEGLLDLDKNKPHDRPNFPNGMKGRDVVCGQMVLLLDTELEGIPWESLPALRELQVGVTRVPSLAFLEHQLRRQALTVNRGKLLYVVNPGGDLERTEETFKDHDGFRDWDGFFGRVSKEDVWRKYQNQSIYLYCGHGAGDQYLSPRKFSKQGEAPIALLMGCSSARPTNSGMGDCESNGPAIDYLIQGSRAVVGNLWDVGDRDIDRFTSSLLQQWLGVDRNGALQGRKLNLAEAMAVSRSVCRLPFLVGAASIVIGAPDIRTTD